MLWLLLLLHYCCYYHYYYYHYQATRMWEWSRAPPRAGAPARREDVYLAHHVARVLSQTSLSLISLSLSLISLSLSHLSLISLSSRPVHVTWCISQYKSALPLSMWSTAWYCDVIWRRVIQCVTVCSHLMSYYVVSSVLHHIRSVQSWNAIASSCKILRQVLCESTRRDLTQRGMMTNRGDFAAVCNSSGCYLLSFYVLLVATQFSGAKQLGLEIKLTRFTSLTLTSTHDPVFLNLVPQNPLTVSS